MNLSMHNPALLRGILAGTVVLSGLSACSRSDRADSGRDTTQSASMTPSDTGLGASTTQAPAEPATQPTGDTATATARAEAPRQRIKPSARKSRQGYREMNRDTSAVPSNPVDLPRADTASAEMAGAADTSATGSDNSSDSAATAGDQALTADTAVAGYSEMARDTSSSVALGDTAAAAITDTTSPAQPDTAAAQAQADTATVTAQADTGASIQVETDTTVAQVNADTTADSVSSQGDQAAAEAVTADTLQDNAGRIRPPEDSTELAGNVTGDTTSSGNGEAADQSETERIRPPEDSTEIAGNVTSDYDRADAASSETTDAAGAAAMGHNVTGIDAVSTMTRAGARCVVKDDSNAVWWDMSDSPSALNPCGTGTMTLSLVKTGEE